MKGENLKPQGTAGVDMRWQFSFSAADLLHLCREWSELVAVLIFTLEICVSLIVRMNNLYDCSSGLGIEP